MSKAAAPSRSRLLRRIVSPAAIVRLAILVGLLPVAGLFGGSNWRLDLFNHFQAQYFGCVLLAVVACLLWRRWRLALVSTVPLLLPAARLAPLYLPVANGTGGKPDALRVASFNVLTSNDRYDDVIHWIRSTDPDVLYLPETDATWNRRLAPLSDCWPYFIDHPVDGNFGFSFRSKYPIDAKEIVELGRLELPLLRAVVSTPTGPVAIFGVHPVPPITELYASERDRYLAELAKRVAAEEGRIIVLGDFNATPWSRSMTPLWQTGLHDTAKGHGFSATWHRDNPLAAIPIDHILTRGFPPCRQRQTGPDLGSDHRPVVAGLAL